MVELVIANATSQFITLNFKEIKMNYERYNEVIHNVPVYVPVFVVIDVNKELQEYNDIACNADAEREFIVMEGDYVYSQMGTLYLMNGLGMPNSHLPPANVEFCGYVRNSDLDTCAEIFGN
jgi:hypothetical protein